MPQGQCSLWPYCLRWWWCQHHQHLFINQYQHTGFVQEEAPIADGQGEGLTLLPFLAQSARSGFWIRTWELVWVILDDQCSFVLLLQDCELPLEFHRLGFKLSNFWVSLHYLFICLLAETFSSANLTSSVRLSWSSLYHSTFLSDSEDALSSIWQTMIGHAIQKAFLTSLGSISTIGAFDTSTMCEAYASDILHPSWCVVVMKWGNPWMSHILDFSPASKIFATPFNGTHISLISISGSIF